MKPKNSFLTRISFTGDIALFISLLHVVQWHWFPVIVACETIMWFVRLIWINPSMLNFILRHLFHMIPIVLDVVAIGFFLIYLAPGDIFTQMEMNTDIERESLDQFRKNFGLDKPWYIQFFRYIWNALHGDFGFSQIYKAPVFTLVSQRLSILFSWPQHRCYLPGVFQYLLES